MDSQREIFIMDRERFVLDLYYKAYGIEGYVFDDRETLCFQSGSVNTSVKKKAQELYTAIFPEGCEEMCPRISVDSNMIAFWGFFYQGKGYLFGPVSITEVGTADILRYRYENHIADRNYVIPKIALQQLWGYVSMGYCLLTGKMLTIEEIQRENVDIQKVDMREYISYQVYQADEERTRISYELGLRWLNDIEQGKLTDKFGSENADIYSQIGLLAKDNDFKQAEYMMVSGITLATRAAIQGGAKASLCYDISDLYLQKLAKTKSVMELYEVGRLAIMEFTNLVSERKKEQKYGTLIERCKDYIAKELYHAFTIQQMSEDLAVNRTYLSKCFSQQTGMTIHDYLIGERLKAAANLLKYSDNSVAQIADYMQFSSAGRFAGYFKERYGMTPSEYRKENKSIHFIKSDNKTY